MIFAVSIPNVWETINVLFAVSVPNVWGTIDKLVTQDLKLHVHVLGSRAFCYLVREGG